jgi:hypothetical protein
MIRALIIAFALLGVAVAQTLKVNDLITLIQNTGNVRTLQKYTFPDRSRYDFSYLSKGYIGNFAVEIVPLKKSSYISEVTLMYEGAYGKESPVNGIFDLARLANKFCLGLSADQADEVHRRVHGDVQRISKTGQGTREQRWGSLTITTRAEFYENRTMQLQVNINRNAVIGGASWKSACAMPKQ